MKNQKEKIHCSSKFQRLFCFVVARLQLIEKRVSKLLLQSIGKRSTICILKLQMPDAKEKENYFNSRNDLELQGRNPIITEDQAYDFTKIQETSRLNSQVKINKNNCSQGSVATSSQDTAIGLCFIIFISFEIISLTV